MITDAQPPSVDSRRAAQWQRSSWILLRTHLARAGWFLLLAVVASAAIIFAVSRFITPQMSALQFTFQGVLWFQFAMMITVFFGYADAHVANGMTRRSFTVGSLVAAFGAALSYGLMISLLLVAEGWIYGRLGWLHGLSDERVEVLASGLWPYVWGAIVLFFVADLSGLLVSATYHRIGGWWGTLCLPLTMAPLLLVSTLVLDRRTQWTLWDLTTDVFGDARPVLAMVVIAVSTLVYFALLRRMPIAARTG